MRLHSRTVIVAALGVVVTMVATGALRGDLLSQETIAGNMKALADTDHNHVLTPREIRIALTTVIRKVVARDPGFDVNGDGDVSRKDIADAVRAFRALLISDCGNGVREGSEQCDDGNASDGDACTNQCTNAACGDGAVQGAEQCDGGDGCTNACTYNILGCITALPYGQTGQQYSGKMRLPSGMNQSDVWLRLWPCAYDRATCMHQTTGGARISIPNDDVLVTVRGDGSFVAQGVYNTGEYTFYLIRLTNGQPDGVLEQRTPSTSCPTRDYPVCGNGQKEQGENCDWAQNPPDFGGFSCSTYNFSGGQLTCTGNCGFSADHCTP